MHIRRKTADSGINMNAEIALDPEEIFPSERRQIIVGVLQREGKVVAAELSSRLKVSIDTIRRDLNQQTCHARNSRLPQQRERIYCAI